MNQIESLDTLGKRLSYLRKASNTTQQALATSINVARSNLTKYEQDKVKPTSDVIVNICEYFKVSADWFLRGTLSENNSATSTNQADDIDPNFKAWVSVYKETPEKDRPYLLAMAKAFSQSIPKKNVSPRSQPISTNTDEEAAAIDDDNTSNIDRVGGHLLIK